MLLSSHLFQKWSIHRSGTHNGNFCSSLPFFPNCPGKAQNIRLGRSIRGKSRLRDKSCSTGKTKNLAPIVAIRITDFQNCCKCSTIQLYGIPQIFQTGLFHGFLYSHASAVHQNFYLRLLLFQKLLKSLQILWAGKIPRTDTKFGNFFP